MLACWDICNRSATGTEASGSQSERGTLSQKYSRKLAEGDTTLTSQAHMCTYMCMCVHAHTHREREQEDKRMNGSVSTFCLFLFFGSVRFIWVMFDFYLFVSRYEPII